MPVTFAAALAALLVAPSTQAQTLRLRDLSESGAAFAFAGGAGSAGDPLVVGLGPEAAWDVLDFEVLGATPGESIEFLVPVSPPGADPMSSAGEFEWQPARVLARSPLRFEVVPRRERFLVRLVQRAASGDAPYYTWGDFLAWIAKIEASALAQVAVVGQSVQGRPLYRIVVDDPFFGPDKKTVLMVVRQHGDEDGGSYVLEGLVDHLLERRTPVGPSPAGVRGLVANSSRSLRHLRWVIYPLANPDGTVANSRYNANGIDLNRDWERSGCNAGQQPETFALQCDLESWQASFGLTIGGDHHGWGNPSHGGFRYAQNQSVTFVPANAYQEARKDTTVVTRHDPTQLAWQENGGTAGMLRAEMYLRYGFLIHTPEYNSSLSSPAEFRAKGRAWGRAMADTLQAPTFTDREGGLRRQATLGEELFVKVDDADENLSATSAETVSVTLQDPASGDSEVLVLDETGADTGIFRNTSGLALTGAASAVNDGVLSSSAGASVVARYVDDDYPRDASSARLRVTP